MTVPSLIIWSPSLTTAAPCALPSHIFLLLTSCYIPRSLCFSLYLIFQARNFFLSKFTLPTLLLVHFSLVSPTHALYSQLEMQILVLSWTLQTMEAVNCCFIWEQISACQLLLSNRSWLTFLWKRYYFGFATTHHVDRCCSTVGFKICHSCNFVYFQ